MRPPPYMVPVSLPVPSVAPPAYVEHNQAKKVKNHVNLHKDTLKVEVDKDNPDCHLVSFVFDALFDGRLVFLLCVDHVMFVLSLCICVVCTL